MNREAFVVVERECRRRRVESQLAFFKFVDADNHAVFKLEGDFCVVFDRERLAVARNRERERAFSVGSDFNCAADSRNRRAVADLVNRRDFRAFRRNCDNAVVEDLNVIRVDRDNFLEVARRRARKTVNRRNARSARSERDFVVAFNLHRRAENRELTFCVGDELRSTARLDNVCAVAEIDEFRKTARARNRAEAVVIFDLERDTAVNRHAVEVAGDCCACVDAVNRRRNAAVADRELSRAVLVARNLERAVAERVSAVRRNLNRRRAVRRNNRVTVNNRAQSSVAVPEVGVVTHVEHRAGAVNRDIVDRADNRCGFVKVVNRHHQAVVQAEDNRAVAEDLDSSAVREREGAFAVGCRRQSSFGSRDVRAAAEFFNRRHAACAADQSN